MRTSTEHPPATADAHGPPPRGSAPRGSAPHDGAPRGWQAQFLGWVNRRRRLSVLVPVFGLVLTTPHSCPFC